MRSGALLSAIVCISILNARLRTKHTLTSPRYQIMITQNHIKSNLFFQGGIYVFNLLETYVAGLSLLSTVFFEAVAVSWLYGLDNFKSDVNKMLGHTPNIYWRICWKIISPAFLAVGDLLLRSKLKAHHLKRIEI